MALTLRAVQTLIARITIASGEEVPITASRKSPVRRRNSKGTDFIEDAVRRERCASSALAAALEALLGRRIDHVPVAARDAGLVGAVDEEMQAQIALRAVLRIQAALLAKLQVTESAVSVAFVVGVEARAT